MKNLDAKERIILTTKKLIQNKSHVTIKDITDSAYVNVAAVNYHFGSKDNLINIVVQDIIKAFKNDIFSSITNIPKSQTNEETLMIMLDYLYKFVVENVGVLNYILINFDTNNSSSNLLIDEFLNDNEFTNLVLFLLKAQSGIEDQNVLMAKYMLIFSSFIIPLFIELISVANPNEDLKFSWRNNEDLKKNYIKELIKLLGV